jgi:hypothetical protein
MFDNRGPSKLLSAVKIMVPSFVNNVYALIKLVGVNFTNIL